MAQFSKRLSFEYEQVSNLPRSHSSTGRSLLRINSCKALFPSLLVNMLLF